MDLDEIQERWNQIEEALRKIRECHVVDTDPAAREAELLEELDRLEYEAAIILNPDLADD